MCILRPRINGSRRAAISARVGDLTKRHRRLSTKACLQVSALVVPLELNPGFIRVGWFDSPVIKAASRGQTRLSEVGLVPLQWSVRVGRTLATLSLFTDLPAEPL